MTKIQVFIKMKLFEYKVLKNRVEILGERDSLKVKAVQYIDNCLQLLNDIDQKFIEDVYINDASYSQVNYSKSAYYQNEKRWMYYYMKF